MDPNLLLSDPTALNLAKAEASQAGIMLIFAVISLILVLGLYIYSALTFQAIAKKLKHQSPWLAWIPIANIVLLYQLSGTPSWTIILYFVGLVLAAIPVVGLILSIGVAIIAVYWFWMICEKLNRPAWWSIFSAVLFPVWLVMVGIMAWSDAPAKSATPTPTV